MVRKKIWQLSVFQKDIYLSPPDVPYNGVVEVEIIGHCGDLAWINTNTPETGREGVMAAGPYKGWHCNDLADHHFRVISPLEQLASVVDSDEIGSPPGPKHPVNK